MATGTNDHYGIAVYNEQGINVLGNNLFSPKLIGTATLRQRGLGELFVVAADGKELSERDGNRNVPLTALRADGIARAYRDRSPHPDREGGEVRTALTHKYEFSLHGCGESLPLLAAVIHGWGASLYGTPPRGEDTLDWAYRSIAAETAPDALDPYGNPVQPHQFSGADLVFAPADAGTEAG